MYYFIIYMDVRMRTGSFIIMKLFNVDKNNQLQNKNSKYKLLEIFHIITLIENENFHVS